jgi:alpha-ketoglutarate-dependent taurine dioxygenase
MLHLTDIVEGPAAWTRADLDIDQSWIVQFDAADLADIDRALQRVKRDDRIWGEFSREEFELPHLRAKLEGIEREVREGRGVVLLRGFPIQSYSLDDVKTVYWGLGCHLGTVISNNVQGEFVSAVVDQGIKPKDRNRRGNTTNRLLDPHTDPSDIVVLLCMEKAKQGGLSSLASAVSVHNEIVRTNPEYLECLHRGFQRDSRGNGPTGDPDEVSQPIPVYDIFEGRLSCSYGRQVILNGARKAGVKLSPLEIAAVEAVRDLALREDLRVDMLLEPGDIQIINNFRTLHSRSEYIDHEDGRKRLLLRMWINMHHGSPLSLEFAAYVRRGILPRAGRNNFAVGGGVLATDADPGH